MGRRKLEVDQEVSLLNADCHPGVTVGERGKVLQMGSLDNKWAVLVDFGGHKRWCDIEELEPVDA